MPTTVLARNHHRSLSGQVPMLGWHDHHERPAAHRQRRRRRSAPCAYREPDPPAHAGMLPLRRHRFAQGIYGPCIPRRIGTGLGFGHALSTTQLFEFQRFVLNRGSSWPRSPLRSSHLRISGARRKAPPRRPPSKGLNHCGPPISFNLMAAPTSSAARMPVVSTRIKVCHAVWRASRHASIRSAQIPDIACCVAVFKPGARGRARRRVRRRD